MAVRGQARQALVAIKHIPSLPAAQFHIRHLLACAWRRDHSPQYTQVRVPDDLPIGWKGPQQGFNHACEPSTASRLAVKRGRGAPVAMTRLPVSLSGPLESTAAVLSSAVR